MLSNIELLMYLSNFEIYTIGSWSSTLAVSGAGAPAARSIAPLQQKPKRLCVTMEGAAQGLAAPAPEPLPWPAELLLHQTSSLLLNDNICRFQRAGRNKYLQRRLELLHCARRHQVVAITQRLTP